MPQRDSLTSQAIALNSLEHAPNYRNWILALAAPGLAFPLLEVGAGHGTFTGELAKLGPVTALEPDPDSFQHLQHRFVDDSSVETVIGSVDEIPPNSSYSSVILINVLEHIEDDREALEMIRERLTPGGCVVIWVPAFEVLYSAFDSTIGHHRRYRMNELSGLITSTGYEVLDTRYCNLPGYFTWLIFVKWLRLTPESGLGVKLVDRMIIPLVRYCEAKLRPPFGQSILMIARSREEGYSPGCKKAH